VDPCGVRFRGTVLPNVALALVGFVIYVACTQAFSNMFVAKSVVGGVVVGVLTFVGSLLALALYTESRQRRY
jgi:hypothetical protein